MWEFDTLSIGSATLDIFLKSSEFAVQPGKDPQTGQKISLLSLRYGSKMNVEEFALQSGGGGTNSAVGFARLGLRSGVIAEIGTDAAAPVILQDLEREGVTTELLLQEPKEQTAISALLIAADGGRSVATGRGAAQMLTVEDLLLERVRTHWVHLSSVGNGDVVRAVAKWCKKHQISLSWNPGGHELDLLAKGELHLNEVPSTIFCVNDEEAERLTKAGYTIEGAGKTVIVTAGRAGGKYYEFGEWYEYKPHETSDVVQETGAGDAFITGVVAALLYDRNMVTAVQWGVRNSASVIQHMGAKTGLLRKEDLLEV